MNSIHSSWKEILAIHPKMPLPAVLDIVAARLAGMRREIEPSAGSQGAVAGGLSGVEVPPIMPLMPNELFGARLVAGQSAIPAEQMTTAARLAEINIAEVAEAILGTINVNPVPVSKALPLRVVLEDGKVSDGFIRLAQVVSDKRVFLYYRADRPAEVAMANQAKAVLKDKGLEWLAANIIPIQKGEVLPQLMAIAGFERNSRVLFTDTDSADFASSIETTRLKDGLARFIATPDKVSGVRLTAQEYFAVLYLAGEKVLTALGRPSDYVHPAILSIFRGGWAKFIALPIKLLEELKKAAQSLRASAVAA